MLTHERHQFYEFLTERWGTGPAGQLMDLLPPEGADQLVTRKDLLLTAADLRQEMAELRAELRQEMAELRAELRQEMAELRAELRQEMAELRQEMADIRIDMAAIRGEIKQESSDLRKEMAAQGRTILLANIGMWATTIATVMAVR